MTATEQVVDEAVDLSDLDVLDADPHIHARCLVCYPQVPMPPLTPYVALCGKRTKSTGREHSALDVPPDACPECVGLLLLPCQVCGS